LAMSEDAQRTGLIGVAGASFSLWSLILLVRA